MARKIINIGSFNDDPAAERIRESFDKSNENFIELYSRSSNLARYSVTDNYSKDIVVTFNGGVYKSLVDNNLGFVPKRDSLTDAWTKKFNTSIVPMEVEFGVPYNRGRVLYINPTYSSGISTYSKLGFLILVNKNGTVFTEEESVNLYKTLDSIKGTLIGYWDQAGTDYQENTISLSENLDLLDPVTADVIVPIHVVKELDEFISHPFLYSGQWQAELEYPQNMSNRNLQDIFTEPGVVPNTSIISRINEELKCILIYSDTKLYHNYPVFSRTFNLVTNPNEPGVEVPNYWELIAEVNGDSAGRIMNSIPVNLKSGDSLGKYRGKTVIQVPPSGWSLEELMTDIASDYIAPVFSSPLTITSQPSEVEVGTSISGNKIFRWSIRLNDGLIGTVNIQDTVSGITIAEEVNNDGNETIAIPPVIMAAENQTHTWKVTGLNMNGTNISSTFTVTAKFNKFYGPVGSLPESAITGEANRSYALNLNTSTQSTGPNTFTLMTGTTHKLMVVLLPPGRIITSVVDTNNLNANLTSDYILSSIVVQDAGGINRNYNMYTLTLGAPYSAAREGNHLITTN